jgi:hypothetical protein
MSPVGRKQGGSYSKRWLANKVFPLACCTGDARRRKVGSQVHLRLVSSVMRAFVGVAYASSSLCCHSLLELA